MNIADRAKFGQMFDYLSAPDTPQFKTGALAFGRSDSRVAGAIGRVADSGRLSWVVITGGLGKDSNEELWQDGSSEAAYLGGVVISNLSLQRYPRLKANDVHLEEKAMTGFDNANFGLKVIERKKLPIIDSSLTAIAHATSLRRLAATAEQRAAKTGQASKIFRVPTFYNFDTSNPHDQAEAAAELLRLKFWAAKKALPVQSDLPEDLVEFAMSVTAVPTIPSPAKVAVVRHLPRQVRKKILTKDIAKRAA